MVPHIRAVAVATVFSFGLGGCVLAPRAAREERRRAAEAGEPWSAARSARVVPELPASPAWDDVLRRALLANGDLEAAYHGWRAALARIDVAAAWPNTNVSLGYEYMFSDDNLKAWDRTTISVGFDPMQNLSFPTKAMASGRQALEDARAAGARFVAAKLTLQRRVLVAWWEYALLAERLRRAREDHTLLVLAHDVADGLVGAGTAQTALVEAHLASVRAADTVAAVEAELGASRARLNALLGRPADAPLAPPDPLPAARPLAADDAALLAHAAAANPELEAAGRDLAARREAVGRARQEWIPDFNPFVGITGGMSQVAGLAISLPTRVTLIRGAIAEARAMEARAEATATQTGHDLAGELVGTLVAMRDAERRARLWRETIVPAAEQLAASARAGYQAGALELGMMIEAERSAIEARLALAEARVERETHLAALEALAGFDVEALAARDGAPGAAAGNAAGTGEGRS
jgi:outer membrane protein TolC